MITHEFGMRARHLAFNLLLSAYFTALVSCEQLRCHCLSPVTTCALSASGHKKNCG